MIAHLVNTDVGNRGILNVYLHYRLENPNFLHNSAKILLDNYSKVLIITGFPVPPAWKPETDGPPGALADYRAVEKMGGKADILTYPEVENALAPFGPSFVRNPDVSDYSLVVVIETPGGPRMETDTQCRESRLRENPSTGPLLRHQTLEFRR